MILLALTDTLVSAHCPRVNLRCASVSLGPQGLLFLGCSLDDICKFVLLCLQVLCSHSDIFLNVSKFGLLLENVFLGVRHFLHCDFLEKVLILDFLGNGVVFTAVGDAVHLDLVFLHRGVTLYNLVLVLGDGSICIFDVRADLSSFSLELSHLIFKLFHFERKFTSLLEDFIYRRICFLKRIQCLELLLNTHFRVSEIFLNGYEGLPLIYRSFDFLYFFGHIIIYIIYLTSSASPACKRSTAYRHIINSAQDCSPQA